MRPIFTVLRVLAGKWSWIVEDQSAVQVEREET